MSTDCLKVSSMTCARTASQDEASIIWDAVLLEPRATADKPLALRGQADRLQACLRGRLSRQRSERAWLFGPPGSGKTSLVRWTCQQVCPSAGIQLQVEVNCWQHRTLYSVLQAIIDQLKILRAEAQDTNFKLDRIRQALRGQPLVVILDEIDKPMPKQRDEIIYGLLSLPNTSLICIANSTRPLAMMDERVRSRLSPIIIEFPAYSQRELVAILTDRALRALAPGSWSPALLTRIAELAKGDARLAIQTLRQAAAAAEEAGRSRLDRRFVEHRLHEWQNIRHEAELAVLSEDEQLIRDLVTQYSPIGTTRLRGLYDEQCRAAGRKPIARRTFTKYMARLSSAQLLQVAAHPAGPGGRAVKAAAN